MFDFAPANKQVVLVVNGRRLGLYWFCAGKVGAMLREFVLIVKSRVVREEGVRGRVLERGERQMRVLLYPGGWIGGGMLESSWKYRGC